MPSCSSWRCAGAGGGPGGRPPKPPTGPAGSSCSAPAGSGSSAGRPRSLLTACALWSCLRRRPRPNLPPERTSFVEQADEIDELRRLLGSARRCRRERAGHAGGRVLVEGYPDGVWTETRSPHDGAAVRGGVMNDDHRDVRRDDAYMPEPVESVGRRVESWKAERPSRVWDVADGATWWTTVDLFAGHGMDEIVSAVRPTLESMRIYVVLWSLANEHNVRRVFAGENSDAPLRARCHAWRFRTHDPGPGRLDAGLQVLCFSVEEVRSVVRVPGKVVLSFGCAKRDRGVGRRLPRGRRYRLHRSGLCTPLPTPRRCSRRSCSRREPRPCRRTLRPGRSPRMPPEGGRGRARQRG